MFQFLMRMLDDRCPSIDSVQNIGNELTSQTADTDKQQVEDQLSDLNARWNTIVHQADDRQTVLDDTIHMAKQYHEQRDPFLEWIDTSERIGSAVDPIGTEAPVIETQLDHQRAIMDDILQHKPDLDELILTGAELLKFCPGKYIYINYFIRLPIHNLF